MPDEKPKKKSSTVREVKSQLHSGSVLFGMAAGVALLWSFEAWQRSNAAARARMLASPRALPFRSVPTPIKSPCPCAGALVI
jgi:hypothetical protein